MAEIYPNLLDVVSAKTPQGSVDRDVAEMQHKVNPIASDMPMMEGNMETGHQGIIRTGIPTPAWRKLNYGVLPTKAQRKKVVDTCGIIEDWSEIDEEVYNIDGGGAAFLADEASTHIEGIAQTVANTLFSGDTATDPEKFLGLEARFDDLSAGTSANIISAGGTGADFSSMWFIAWGKNTLTGIFPKGQNGGLEVKNLGLETKEDASGSSNRLMRVYRTQFKRRLGLHMKDWQGIVRIANIDVSEAIAGTIDMVDLMIQAFYTVPLRLRQSAMNQVFYCNPSIKRALVLKAKADTSSQLTIEKLENGVPLLSFWGIPVKEVDAIGSAETEIT